MSNESDLLERYNFEGSDGQYENIPESTKLALQNYVIRGQVVGDFLHAILVNDLQGAFAHADSANIKEMNNIVKWVFNRAPGTCWRHQDNINGWYKCRGALGVMEDHEAKSKRFNFDRLFADLRGAYKSTDSSEMHAVIDFMIDIVESVQHDIKGGNYDEVETKTMLLQQTVGCLEQFADTAAHLTKFFKSRLA